MVKGKLMLPVHHGLLNLAYHSWTEPMDRALAAAEQGNVRISIPRPGESLEPANVPQSAIVAQWWPQLPVRAGLRMPPAANLTQSLTREAQ